MPRRRRPFPDTGPSGVAGAACCPAGFSALLNGSCRRCACGVPRETFPAVGDEGVLALVVLDFGGEVRRVLLAVERLLTLPGAVSARLAVVDNPALFEFISPPFQNRCQVRSHPSGHSDGSSRRDAVVARNSGRAKCATGLRIWLRGNSTRARALRLRPPHHADARHRAPRHGRSRAGSPALVSPGATSSSAAPRPRHCSHSPQPEPPRRNQDRPVVAAGRCDPPHRSRRCSKQPDGVQRARGRPGRCPRGAREFDQVAGGKGQQIVRGEPSGNRRVVVRARGGSAVRTARSWSNSTSVRGRCGARRPSPRRAAPGAASTVLPWLTR